MVLRSGNQVQMRKPFSKVKNQLLELFHTVIQKHLVDNNLFKNFTFTSIFLSGFENGKLKLWYLHQITHTTPETENFFNILFTT